MALDLKPMRWDWSPVVTGDTYPATNITADITDTTLSRVRVKIKPAGEATAAITLDSNATGITINNAATWDFTIAAITAPEAGVYAYDLETTDSAGSVRTRFFGTWPILSEITN